LESYGWQGNFVLIKAQKNQFFMRSQNHKKIGG